MFDQEKKPVIPTQPENQQSQKFENNNQGKDPANFDIGNKTQQQNSAMNGNFDLNQIKVHTMPEKFLSANKQKIVKNKAEVLQTTEHVTAGPKNNLKRNILIGSIIGVVVIGLLGLGAWFLIKSIETPQEEQMIEEQQKTEEQINQETEKQEEEEVVVEEMCSAENCFLCNQEECNLIPEACYWETNCLPDDPTCMQGMCVKLEEYSFEEELDTESGAENIVLEMSIDSDFDLLTDVEEVEWGTNALNTDTDGDGYNDGVELVNLYNPNVSGSGTGKLIESNLIKVFENLDYDYSIFYPTSWQVQSDFLDQVIFIPANGDFVQIIVQDNFDGFSAKDWYLQQNSDIDESELIEVELAGMSGVKTLNGLNIYLADENYIYILSYNVGLRSELDYKTTFEMMQKSFQVNN